MSSYNFGGLDGFLTDPETAKIIIFPVSYDGTVTFKQGTRDGAAAIISASRELEYYDEETDYEVYQLGIATLPLLSSSSSFPQSLLNKIKKVGLKWLNQGKFIVMLGGEHLLSLGMIKAHAEKIKEFSILHLDAHADLKKKYNNTSYSNACVMYLAHKYAPIVSVGLRSLCKEEAQFIQTKTLPVFYAREVKDNLEMVIKKILNHLKDRIYLTIDLDCFDCGQMPSVGTPEPGGLDWYEILAIIKTLTNKKEIIGFDVMELCPQPKLIAPDFLAAKLVYKTLSYIFAPK
jgi:agmatinase